MVPYSLVMLLAVGVGGLLLRRSQGRLDLAPHERLGVGLGAFCGAMLGAKLPFVLADWQAFLAGTAWFADGKTILLGLAGGYLGVEIAKWCLDIQTRTGDTFAVPVAVSIAIGRVGCFFGGCCFGTPTDLPWGVVFPHADACPRHPTQLYEAAFHAMAALLLAGALSRGLWRGHLIKVYIIGYAIIYRFFSEFLRPEARFVGDLTAYQWASVVLALGFLWLWRHDERRVARESPASP
jgi:phosphatidylglycerol:prolipoprotein diacylglycerol transferase